MNKNTTWLQGLGETSGKPANDLVPGDVTIWNYGYTSKVVSRVRETAKTVTFELTSLDDHEPRPGKSTTRTFLKTRIVAVLPEKLDEIPWPQSKSRRPIQLHWQPEDPLMKATVWCPYCKTQVPVTDAAQGLHLHAGVSGASWHAIMDVPKPSDTKKDLDKFCGCVHSANTEFIDLVHTNMNDFLTGLLNSASIEPSVGMRDLLAFVYNLVQTAKQSGSIDPIVRESMLKIAKALVDELTEKANNG